MEIEVPCFRIEINAAALPVIPSGHLMKNLTAFLLA
jgi:hypothetical protein